MKLSINKPQLSTEGQQRGINMVDLMMWLVIAALLLAAAIQGIGYYQKSAYVYQMSEDVSSIATTATAIAASNGRELDSADIEEAIANTRLQPDTTVTWGTVAESGAQAFGEDTGFELASSVSVPAAAPAGHVYVIKATHTGAQDRDVVYFFEQAGTYETGLTVVNKDAVAVTPAPESSSGTGGAGGSGAETTVSTTLTVSRTIGQKTTFTWDAVTGATGYTITAGGTTYTVEGGSTTSTTIALPTSFDGTATIKPVVTGATAVDSAPVAVKIPTNVITVQAGTHGWSFAKTEITGNTNNISDLVNTTYESSMVSESGLYVMAFRTDGSMVIYNTSTGAATRTTMTSAPNTVAAYMNFQGDGNLVAYTASMSAIKATGTHQISKPATLTLHDDGTIAIRNASGTVRFTSLNTTTFMRAP